MSGAIPVSPLLAQGGSNAALVTFLLYTLAVFGLAALSNRLLQSKSFLSEYFLGSRSLGVWAFALTFAATSSSGGSFTGFPSKIYTHGWILALWIGSYMVVPICTMGLLGKRINQVARISGAITVPDVLRDRFDSRSLGILATVLIVFFMSFNLIAQFKAGSLILATLLDGVDAFHSFGRSIGSATVSIPFLAGVSGEYLACLLTFGVAVIIYTTWGGFHAVVWTDVMQGVVMVVGVIILLPLAISQVGGLENATQRMAEMTPPAMGTATLQLESGDGQPREMRSGIWAVMPSDDAGTPRLFRTTESVSFDPVSSTGSGAVLEVTSPEEVQRILDGRTTARVSPDVTVIDADVEHYAYPSDKTAKGVYVTGPGPDPKRDDGFLPFGLAVSFFFMWAISGSGQPSNMVRLMAFKNAATLRRAIFTVAIYYSLIYFPLVIIFCCARVLMPGMDAESDRIMPAMAVFLTENIGAGWLAGLLVAAPFAAVMSTVDSFLLMISSAIVRDVYQRNINPDASEQTIKRMSYLCTLLIGTAAMIGAVNPPQFLQDIIVYVGSGLAACFLGPMVYALYWPRVNLAGTMSGMLAGFSAHLLMYVMGIFANGTFFRPYRLLGCNPVIVGLVTSFVVVIVVTLITRAPDQELVRRYFHAKKAKE